MNAFVTRDEVFIAGGQPTITYVDRQEEHVERSFARAIATPNQIVSLSGPSKTGKTVLCRKVLSNREYVWVDGGQISDATSFWNAVCAELSMPSETETTRSNETELGLEGKVPLVATAKGSQLFASSFTEKKTVATVANAIAYMLKHKIILVIDDFHYIEGEVAKELMRNIKGAVFNGLKAVLLSVTHRVFDAIKAESELTGRFIAVTLPHWTEEDLRQIPIKGFKALNIQCDDAILDVLCKEAQESPFLMQKFCWEICFELDIDRQAIVRSHVIPSDFDLNAMFRLIAKDAGLPIYQKLAAGPQSRKVRAKRPLKDGSEVDIYQAILLALAETGPKSAVPYDELRASLNDILKEMVPQKHEITSALKHLAKISKDIGAETAVDWDDAKREINIAEPYLRFFLRWQIKRNGSRKA
ncbi:MAG: hypothetical protein R3C60_02870 [Parvularculaceae bacterium]